jgi:hypothetical protein
VPGALVPGALVAGRTMGVMHTVNRMNNPRVGGIAATHCDKMVYGVNYGSRSFVSHE